MSPIFSKLNLTTQETIFVLDAPESFQEELSRLSGIEIVDDLKSPGVLAFALVFVIQKSQIDRIAPALAKKAKGDAIVWFAYPKGTSKKYQCDFNRDTGWDTFKALGFDTVRQVAIDADWSALRFRRVEFIGSR
ncbi:MAG TPA: hypothetical protein VK832_11985 [Burkholderiaceae bacterium]|jgi:hypothetical protein|nr:hypothetical protein [Burkholderiaceae bacterium]